MWRSGERFPLAAEAASAAVVALAFFGVLAGVLALSTNPVVVVVLAAVSTAIVVWAASRGADLYAVPVALAAVLAFDFFYLPPLREFGFPDYANWGALGLYIVVTVLVCTIGARTRRRVDSLLQSQAELAREQAALRRVATLVAQETPATEVFAAVAEEVGILIGADSTRVFRYETDGTATVMAGWKFEGSRIPGHRVSLEGESVTAKVYRTHRPARMDAYADAAGELAAELREAGIRSGVGCPIVVAGRLWGAMVAVTARRDGFPSGAELHLAGFTELVAAAISNSQARADLTASRERIVRAADDTRQRIERDLHDGIQQRLVSLALDLQRVESQVPAEAVELRRELTGLSDGLTGVLGELREISRGIHPAILSEGGLEPALKALSRRSAVPVSLDVRTDRRLQESVEVAVYYVVSEALTNAAKHAQASVVDVAVVHVDGAVDVSIRDDGVGGADPVRGSGLIGLGDRVEVLGGKLEISSPPREGTALHITFPVARH